MAEDKSEDSEPSPVSGRANRAPPTIDLEATEISGDTQNAGAGAEPKRSLSWPSRAAVFAAVVAVVSGAGAAALVIAVAWLAGWPGEVAPPTAAPPADRSRRPPRAPRRRYRGQARQASGLRPRSGGGQPHRSAGEILCLA